MTIAIGLDLGTTSISAVAVRDDGAVAKVVSRRHAADVDGLPTGWAEQDPERLRQVSVDILRELVAGLDEPFGSLGVTGQMHGGLLLDDARRPLTNLITWQDRRANETDVVDRLRLVDGVTATGTRPAPGFLGVTLAVLAERGEIPSAACRASMLVDWIVAAAIDGESVTDPTNAASSGVYDVRNGCWSDALVTSAGFSRELLPDVCDSSSVVGMVSPSFASETGLPAGIPVANAIGDHQASVLGSVPTGEPVLHVNVGTGGQIDWAVEEFVRVPGMDTRPLADGRLMLVGAGLAGGDAFAWVSRAARRWADELGLAVDDDAFYGRLLALAEEADVRGGGLACVPTFRGTRTNPTATGSFTGITPDNFGLGDVSLAVLCGIVEGFRGFRDAAGDLAPQATRIIGTGNALARNDLLRRLLERRFELEVWQPVHAEAAAYGAALHGGVAAGGCPGYRAAGRLLQLER